jgi:hypothetical protein
MNAYNPPKEKSSNYLEQTIEEMRALLNGAGSAEEAQNLMERFLSEKLRQSFKNGIEAGMNKANGGKGRNGREYRGTGARQYRKR